MTTKGTVHFAQGKLWHTTEREPVFHRSPSIAAAETIGPLTSACNWLKKGTIPFLTSNC